MGIAKDHLESVIDEIGLSALLNEIAEIAREKADHLRSNWQDETSAKLWDKDADRIEKVSAKLNS